MMKAAVVGVGGRLSPAEVPTPEPEGSDVVLRVRHCGLGKRDVEQAVRAEPGSILGREIVGEVVALGPDVDEGAASFEIGKRVVSEATVPCAACGPCEEQRFRSCESGWRPLGEAVAGGFAEFVRVHAAGLLQVDDSVSDGDASLAVPAATALQAVRRSKLVPGDACAILGAGTVGALALQAALLASPSRVDVIEPVPARRDRATELGATAVFGPEDDFAGAILDSTGYGPDVVFECSGEAGALQEAASLIRPGGRVVLVGRYPGEDSIETIRWILREIDLLAVNGGADRLPQAVQAITAGDVGGPAFGVETIGLGELDATLRDWRASQNRKRILVRPQDESED